MILTTEEEKNSLKHDTINTRSNISKLVFDTEHGHIVFNHISTNLSSNDPLLLPLVRVD